MDISKFFDRGSKKRDLSDQSNDDDGAKKIRDESLTSLDEGSVFGEGVDNMECRGILFNCLQNLEKQMKELLHNTNESQIKGEKQLKDLTDSVGFISAKIDEYEKERKQSQIVINDLKKEVVFLSKSVVTLESRLESQEQYLRRNCVVAWLQRR